MFMNRYLIGFVVSLFSLVGYGQMTDSLRGALQPTTGACRLIAHFQSIQFNITQKQLLKNQTAYLSFDVDAEGKATLTQIRGTNGADVFDSIATKGKELPRFAKKLVNGTATPYQYFLAVPYYTSFKQGELENYVYAPQTDCQLLDRSKSYLSFNIGAFAATFAGNAAEHLNTGGGVRLGLDYTFNNGIGFGGSFGRTFSSFKKRYSFTEAPNSQVGGWTFGVNVHKTFKISPKSHLCLKAEFNIITQSFDDITKVYYVDSTTRPPTIFSVATPVPYNLTAISPGLSINYALALSDKQELGWSMSQLPTTPRHYLNFHAAIRPLFYDKAEASGIMFEVGISYKRASHSLTFHRAKPGLK